MTEITRQLATNGEAQKNNIREKAAQSIANNINGFLSKNNFAGYYDHIKVVFNDDVKDYYRLYEFKDNSVCSTRPCKLELNFAETSILLD